MQVLFPRVLSLYDNGDCADLFQSFDVILGPINQVPTDTPPEDPSPSTDKVYQDHDGHWVITDVQGLKLGVRWRVDGQGYDIVKSESHCPSDIILPRTWS